MTRIPVISPAAARRIALAAQGFADQPPAGRADARHIRRVLSRVGLLQIDSVNVLCRSHYLPVFARLGDYPRDTLDRLSWGGRRRELFEYWAHEASLVPMRLQPYLRWRMAKAADAAWAEVARIGKERPGFVDQVYAQVAEKGPIGAGAIEVERPRKGGMWNWHDGKIALEWLFYCGKVTTAGRPNFERLYDLTERVIPAEILNTPTPDRDESMRELVRVAARGYGVATERDLRDYFRLGVADARQAVAELVEAGELEPVAVAGWRHTGYLYVGARMPRRVRARALLSPFDSLVWERARAERLFDFRYRIEIYTPAARRVYGYYVLPFLLGERLVGRVDLKSDRQAGVLRVRAAHQEDGVDPAEVAPELAAELIRLSEWLGLSGVQVEDRGELAPWLGAAVRS